ncbi:Cation transport regulator chaB [Klebsiella pneumoniae IS22]|nr:Cation transport regulator chaB [Klebsiella pneumoniae IS22]
MPYKTKSDLPESVKHVLPSHAQDIYKEAFNSAWDQYKDKEDRRDDASREETAHKVAWAAVKHEYAKGMMINGIKNRKTGSLVKAIRAVLPCKWSVDCILSR